MAIMIKGMEMPENCIDCFAETYNECMATGKIVNSIGRPDWCPLVEVPKHGRLIDADELMSTIKEHDYLLYDRLTDTTKPGMFTFGIAYAVCNAPTIIEAEE